MFQITRALVVLFFLASCGVTRDSGALGEVPEGGHGEVEAAVSDQHEIDGYVELARAAFAALKSGNIEDYGSFAPGEADYRWFVGVVMEWFVGVVMEEFGPEESETLTPSELDEWRRRFAPSGAEQFAQDFAETRASSSDVIDWGSAVFDGIDRSRLRNRTLACFECVDVYFYVTVDGERYTFKLLHTVDASERKISLRAVVFKGATASLLLLPEDRPLRPDTLEGAAKLVLEALKAGEYARYKPLLPTYEDIYWYYEGFLASEWMGHFDLEDILGSMVPLPYRKLDVTIFDGLELLLLGVWEEEPERPRRIFGESEFNLTRGEAGEDIDWSSAVFVDFHKIDPDLMKRNDPEDWMTASSLVPAVSFWVRDDERLHTLTLRPMKSPSGWFLPFPLEYNEVRRAQLPSSEDIAFEDAAKLAFRALQSESFTEYGPLVPTQESLEWVMGAVRANLGLVKFNRLMAAQGGKEKLLANKRETCKKDFFAAREKSASAFDWSSATFAGLDRTRLTWWEKQGVKRVRTGFWVEAEGAMHLFRFVEAIQHPNGVIIEGLQYLGELSR